MQELPVIAAPVAQAEKEPYSRKERLGKEAAFFPENFLVQQNRPGRKTVHQAFHGQDEHAGGKRTVRSAPLTPTEDKGQCPERRRRLKNNRKTGGFIR